jgi:CheY-like chemotaxis protein
MDALGVMSGGIAHDFNNILAAIMGFTDIVRGHLPPGSRDARSLERVMEAGLRGRELIKQMLAFSRKGDLVKRPLVVAGVVKETVKLLRASIPTTISIEVKVEREPGMILGDPVQLQQVLMNLSTNAAHAMREKGGSLTVELTGFSASRRNSLGLLPGPYLKLVVKDTGEGIPEGDIEKIFDPFFTTKKKGEGTGLGLSAVHGIVRQLDGRIMVESRLGEGTTFSVFFPKIEKMAMADGVDGEAAATGHERILFVDDEEPLVEMGADILQELGYQVACRTGSRAALALFKLDPSQFDLIITDQTMPEMTGIELAREAMAIRPGIPVILCTGYSHRVDADAAKKVGIRAFAMKPLTKKEIAKIVRKVLDAPSPA